MKIRIFIIIGLLSLVCSCAEDIVISDEPDDPYVIVENVEGTFSNKYDAQLDENRAEIRFECDLCLKHRLGRRRCTGVDLIEPNMSFVNLCSMGNNYCSYEYEQPDNIEHVMGGLPLFWEITGYDTIIGLLKFTYMFLDTMTVDGQCEIVEYGDYVTSDTVTFVFQE